MGPKLTAGDKLLHTFEALESQREYSRPELIERRQQRLLASAAGFFRGTPSLFYALLKNHPDAKRALGKDTRWIVGDVHMENVGVIEIGVHRVAFDFNDLDEAVIASPVLDVIRGAAGAAIAASDLNYGARAAVCAAEALIVSYLRPLAEEAPPTVTALMKRAAQRTHENVLDERAPVTGGERRFVLGKRYLDLSPERRTVAEKLFADYAESNPIPSIEKRLRLEDCAFRVQGTGSLGVERLIFLARAGKKGEQMLFEGKEMRKSAVVLGGMADAGRTPPGGQAARVAKAVETLLAEPQVGVRALKGDDGRSYLVRLHAPGEDKLALTTLQGEADLVALARMIGYRLSQAHERAAKRPPPALDPGLVLSVALDLVSAVTRTHLAYVMRANGVAKG